ncbi:MAG: Single-stranded DNA-binding protein [Parcubacteria group bacterium GW2011_GWA2_56_21]|nr:MAG: Single-stranded DNA-binding protein [Parcubacteria group bacterium GW2011_GWA2_56_21]
MYLNKAFLYGNLTRDPELKVLPSGGQVVNFGLATNRTYKDKNGAKQEATEFHNIVAFGRTAEVIAQYMKGTSHTGSEEQSAPKDDEAIKYPDEEINPEDIPF